MTVISEGSSNMTVTVIIYRIMKQCGFNVYVVLKYASL